MDVRRSRLPKNPVNIGGSAQKSAKQGDGPSARGTQSTKEGNSHRDKVKLAHKSGYVLINHKQIALLLAASLIQSCFFTAQLLNSLLKLNSLSGLRPRPHARRGISLRSSLLGASGFTQPTAVIMRHAKQSAPERPFEVSIFLYRSGARFCSKGRRITLLSGAARMPIKRKAAQPYFKANDH